VVEALKRVLPVVLSAAVFFSSVVFPAVLPAAETTAVTRAACPSTFPNLITDICWKCMFPLRIGGMEILHSGGIPDAINTANSDDFNPGNPICLCSDSLGVPSIGTYVSFWEPAKVLEVTQIPGCFSFLAGADFADVVDLFGAYGTKGSDPANGSDNKAFYNVHSYMAPLMTVLNLIQGAQWCNDAFLGVDLDIAYFTEADPLWNNDELSLWLNGEALVFGNPIAQALCAVDCGATTVGYPLNPMFWCAGCWGSLYPFTGNVGTVGSPVRTTSLLAARVMAKMARVPVPPSYEMDTSGSGAKCGGVIRPVLKKSQYRFATLFPIAETKMCHTLGANTMAWGEWRNIPGTGEFQSYLLWRKRNCCMRIF